ncbi:E3 ubiquitin-protein ligase RNF169 [Carettochelys insculpta]|uniref:E3 ubiquitin-protein ligase RNF169 n=1 Tax=Carettochelys insculpta TaxID=44489 RepID=UPI003EBA41F1
MAAAGPGGRAAVSVRRGRRRRPADEETAECPLCRGPLAEAVTPPCRHSLCRPCFQRCLQGPGLCCPLCRSRLSTWARRQQSRAAGRAEPGAAAAAPGGGEQRAPDEDFIFREPIKLSKPGELREEYESQLRKMREEKLQDEKASEDLIHKLILEDMEVGKRKMEEQQKKDDPIILKMNQEFFPERLSDSENEEPFQCKHTHRSAFVSKGSTYSFTFLTGNLTSKLERSQSCSDTIQDRSKSRQRSVPANRAKVTSITSTSTPIVGVLSSTQNNRCLSAPDLTAEKRLVFNSISSLSILHKPERSISPESNDSISEELNHFKPIVCSPCTPPKRLPDGKVLSPLIIKSTPRNLTRSLQKPTTYEASPRILKKWEQIFQERQIKKTFSKATLTSLASETGEDSANSTKEQPRMLNDQIPPDAAVHTNTEFDYFPSISDMELEWTGIKKTVSLPLMTGGNSSEPETRANGISLNTQVSDVSEIKTNSYLDKSCVSIGAKIMTRIIGVNPVLPGNSVLGVAVKTAGKKQLKYLNNSELINVQNGTCNSVENIIGEQSPSLRRGRKRHCKTKHLEQNGSIKRLKQTAGEMGLATEDPLVREMDEKLQQEEEDRRLALQLQQIFDSENRIVDRRKGRVDQYLLRSKSTTSAK